MIIRVISVISGGFTREGVTCDEKESTARANVCVEEGAGDSVSKNKEEWKRAARVAGWDHRRVRVVRGCTALRWHGAREGDSPPLVTAAKRQDFPHRVHREMGADPCPQTEAGPTPPPEWCGGTRRHEVGRAERPHSVAKVDIRLKCDQNVIDDI